MIVDAGADNVKVATELPAGTLIGAAVVFVVVPLPPLPPSPPLLLLPHAPETLIDAVAPPAAAHMCTATVTMKPPCVWSESGLVGNVPK